MYFPTLQTNTRKRDFSNFPSDIAIHHNLDMLETNRQARKWRSIRDKSTRERYTKKHGLRWSELRSLCYYNVHRQTVTDSMHGLFLSQTSLLMKLYEEFGLIKPFDYESLAEATTSIMPPSKYDRFYRSLKMGFAWMKADNYRVWLLLFGPYILYRISDYCHHSIRIRIKGKGLSKEHYDNFLEFHLACRLILQPSLDKEEVSRADRHFLNYNRSFVKLFTAEHSKPYNHLLLHLSQNILDFSSVTHTWCFSYERYNFLLKSIETNKKNHFEKTIMRRFVEKSNSMSFIKEFDHVLSQEQLNLLYATANSNGHMGNLPSTTASKSLDFPPIDAHYYQQKRDYYRLSSFEMPTVTGSEELPGMYIDDDGDVRSDDDKNHESTSLDAETFGFLVDHYTLVYDGVYNITSNGDFRSCLTERLENEVVVDNIVVKKASIEIEGLSYRSLWKGSKTGAGIQAHFQGSHGANVGLYPGVVSFYFDHYLELPDGRSKRHAFAYCKWFTRGSNSRAMETHTQNTIEVWRSSFENVDKNCILPVPRIYGQIAVDVKKPNAYVIPMIRKIYL
ncbi:hypothetical protein PS15m_012383 [Mucor circinelloides]